MAPQAGPAAQGVWLPLPAAGADLKRHVDQQLAGGRLDPALDLSVVEFDELAQLAGVTVTGVDASGDDIAVRYCVHWTAFHACDDRSFGGTHARVLRGRRGDDGWVFRLHEPLPVRQGIYDEF